MRGLIAYCEQLFELEGGGESHVAVHLSEATRYPGLLTEMGSKIAHTVWNHTGPDDADPCLIGLPTAGTALAIAASLFSWYVYSNSTIHAGRPLITSRVMRATHTAKNRWVHDELGGQPPDRGRHTFWTVDGVVTDVTSMFEAAARLAKDGYSGKQMPQLIFIDRQQGTLHRLIQGGFTQLCVCFNLLDVACLFGELGLWPRQAVTQVEAEIETYQF